MFASDPGGQNKGDGTPEGVKPGVDCMDISLGGYYNQGEREISDQEGGKKGGWYLS